MTNLLHDGGGGLRQFLVIIILFAGHLIAISVSSTNNKHQPREQFCKTEEGRAGFCINLKSQIKFCPKLYALLNGTETDWEKLRRSLCAKQISKDETRVCCPHDSYDEETSSASRGLEPQAYSQHANFKLLPHDLKCGLSSNLNFRIIGGEGAKPGDFPWMARISLSPSSSSSSSQDKISKNQPNFHCSGTIINNRYILTAAHCLLPVLNGTHNLSVIRLAETDENVNPESITISDGYVLATSPYLDYEHEQFITHPNYTGTSSSPHDIALIRLKKPINTSSEFTQPVCLPFVKDFYLESDKIDKYNGTVSGWGKTSTSTRSSVLMYVGVPIHSNILCRIVYQNSHNINNQQICAGGRKGQNSCSGDSGGPLTNGAKSKSGRHFQIGIVSFGKAKCAGANEPVIYTKVQSYLTWILDNIRE